MQDRYAGDVGDFGKLGLLQELEHIGFSIGVNWYKALPANELDQDGNFKNKDGKHRIKPVYYPCDEILSKKLLEIFDSDDRSIQKLEDAGLLDRAVYYNKIVSTTDRGTWHTDALKALEGCDLVFLDPDNGLQVKSVGERSEKSTKYVLDRELSDYLHRGQSVVLYNHRPRKKFDDYLDDFRERFAEMDDVKGKHIVVMSFHKGSTRDYFLIAANKRHAEKIESATTHMIGSRWGALGLFSKCSL